MKTFDIDECAEFLKINRTTATEMAASGELPGAKIGRAWVFLVDDLIEYLRNKIRQQQRERLAEAELEKVASKKREPAVLPTMTSLQRPKSARRNVPPPLPELVEVATNT